MTGPSSERPLTLRSTMGRVGPQSQPITAAIPRLSIRSVVRMGNMRGPVARPYRSLILPDCDFPSQPSEKRGWRRGKTYDYGSAAPQSCCSKHDRAQRVHVRRPRRASPLAKGGVGGSKGGFSFRETMACARGVAQRSTGSLSQWERAGVRVRLRRQCWAQRRWARGDSTGGSSSFRSPLTPALSPTRGSE